MVFICHALLIGEYGTETQIYTVPADTETEAEAKLRVYLEKEGYYEEIDNPEEMIVIGCVPINKDEIVFEHRTFVGV